LAAARKISATPRPWSECAADPAAIIRKKFLAEIVSAVAPHKPAFLTAPVVFGSGTRHGPMPQFLQQSPAAPIGQGLSSAALLKTVLTESLLAFSYISCDALSANSLFSSDM
jgi:hypothetical protein